MKKIKLLILGLIISLTSYSQVPCTGTTCIPFQNTDLLQLYRAVKATGGGTNVAVVNQWRQSQMDTIAFWQTIFLNTIANYNANISANTFNTKVKLDTTNQSLRFLNNTQTNAFTKLTNINSAVNGTLAVNVVNTPTVIIGSASVSVINTVTVAPHSVTVANSPSVTILNPSVTVLNPSVTVTNTVTVAPHSVTVANTVTASLTGTTVASLATLSKQNQAITSATISEGYLSSIDFTDVNFIKPNTDTTNQSLRFLNNTQTNAFTKLTNINSAVNGTLAVNVTNTVTVAPHSVTVSNSPSVTVLNPSVTVLNPSVTVTNTVTVAPHSVTVLNPSVTVLNPSVTVLNPSVTITGGTVFANGFPNSVITTTIFTAASLAALQTAFNTWRTANPASIPLRVQILSPSVATREMLVEFK